MLLKSGLKRKSKKIQAFSGVSEDEMFKLPPANKFLPKM
jgi:hypothetical protein